MTLTNIPSFHLPSLTHDQAHLFPILLMIERFIAEKHYPPSYRDIADYFPNPTTHRPASTNSVSCWLLDLIGFGWIEMQPGTCRTLSFTPAGMKLLAEYKIEENKKEYQMPITYDPKEDVYIVGRKGNLKIQPSVGGKQTGGPTAPDFSRVILPSKPRAKPYAPCKFKIPPITQRPKP